MPKVTYRKVQVQDAIKSRYSTYITVYIPKINPHYVVPHVIFDMANGGGHCYFRAKDTKSLIDVLEGLIASLREERWMDDEWRRNEILEHLIDTGTWIQEEKYVDLNELNELNKNERNVDIAYITKNEDEGT